MSTFVSDVKYETESVDFHVDFLSRLALGETIQTAAFAVEVLTGVDPTPNAMLSGSPSISGSIVTHQVVGGLAGVIYTIAASIRTNLGNIIVNQTKLAVLPDAAVVPP